MRVVPLMAGVFAAYLLATHDLTPLKSWASWPLLGYVVYSGISLAWAISGKFVLREYAKIFIASVIFLYIVLKEKFDDAFAQRVMTIIAAMSAIYAYFAIEAASVNIFGRMLHSIKELSGLGVGFTGTRLYGLFGNPNFESSFYAFGILLSIALLCHATEKAQRIIYCVTLSFNAFTFLLAFSMGAIACFVASVVVYLIAVGNERPAALLRMLEAAVPTVIFSFAAYALFNREGLLGFLPLLIMLLNAGVTVLLELALADKLLTVLHAHQKLAIGTVIAVLLLAAAYVVAGFQLTGPYTFGNPITRGAYLSEGKHILTVDADGDVSAVITSQTYAQAIADRRWTIRFGSANDMDFTVPEDSVVCYIAFSAEPGTTIRSASIDGTIKVPLKYKLLPAFAANRIQGLRYRGSALERIPFMQDGIRIWKLRPIFGSGVGAFETALTQVQQIPYTTRYVHNHYIQVLLEGGIIGCALWVGSLIAMAASLWLRRKTIPAQYRWLYPALWAALVMTATQTNTDVSLSNEVFLAYNYALFALNVRVCAKEEGEPAGAGTAKKRTRASRGKPDGLMVRIVCVMLPAAYALTLCGNLVGRDMRNSPVSSADEFFKNMASAAVIDPYEWSDAEASYVLAVLDQNRPDRIQQANKYAEHLSQFQSNSVPYYLVVYYLNTTQYEKGIEAAKLGATYSASSSDTWDQIADALAQCFMDDLDSTPLLTRSETLVPMLMEYYDMYVAYNDYALVPLETNERTYDFFERLLAVNEAIGQPERIFQILAS